MVAPNTNFAASKPDTDTKNRVGRFFFLAAESVGEDRRSSRRNTREKRGCRYDFASVDTEFEYGPFGELIRATGEKKNDFNFRFSTKYEDTETGLLYYGYRYYNAETGRWLNRDPIEERGGLNLYGMVGNDLINKWDLLGMVELTFFYMTEIETATITFPDVPLLRRTFNGGIKTTQTVSVDPDKCIITFDSKSIGRTIEYDSSGAIIGSRRAAGSSIKQSAKKDPKNPCVCVLKMEGNENNPLVTGSPGITYHVTVRIDSGKKSYDWSLTHDRFPSHQFWGHRGSALHYFSHITAGTTPLGLYSESEKDSGHETY